MESKRLGRILPAVINGLSAAQAQSQGLIEEPSDADFASVANSESLFVGESDDESTSSRSRSGSPQKIRDVNDKASQPNPAATPFDPKLTTSTAPGNPNPFLTATTFGKPSSTQLQSNSPPVFDFNNSNPTNSAAHNPFQSKEPPKFDFFPPANTTKAEESKDTPGVFGSKGPPKSSFFSPQSAPKIEGDSNNSMRSPFAPPPEEKPSFAQPSTSFSASTTPQSTKAVAEKPPTSTEEAVPSRPTSIFDQPVASSAPPVFSFGTSPLFGLAGTEPEAQDSKANLLQTSEEKSPNVPAPQQKYVPSKPPTSTIPSAPQSTPFSLFPSNPLTKETSLPPAAPLKPPNSNGTLAPTREPQFSLGSSQSSPILPSSTAPIFQSPLPSPSTKVLKAFQKPTSLSEPTSNSQPISHSTLIKPSGSQPSQQQSTSAPSQLEPRSVALEKLSRIMLLEDNGILQHFIEFTVGPIIKASITQLDDESSWKEASQSSPYGSRCSERMLIGTRGISCSLVGQEVR